ncbi:MAG: UDP-N-acetylmuramoyl-tripeptide--D-alanyl-D-alanine ligase [Flammeovirgaceae bacterium]|nr:UDP-N-acetylmuramoyl-tripeptide--D-alanyl-D-alanine ligase [Flammeovirgaceae bacterium]MBE61036.1 UDP-N-acetylmuramoyl-tripeptide--D-alanyl-D-alanine ligase [Flammeovirgaceae bacterium]HCX21081.1 UDP-N-acetylmuramoyl-tripeptide--D-alanyl-D-alanine ligase [Cytophagales bacterium]|tara:strand:+ start:13665 stop:14939 length:1275 start_codon:yes stop_codon:yes gene_type:complete
MTSFIEFLYSRFLLSDGVSIDTRTITKGNLYFALKGPNFNANKYATKALELGAAYAVVDEEEYVTDERIILADDAQKSLQELAAFHRSRFKRPVLGLTGSNGKTTTKELINRVLATKYITHATKGNLNNHLGVPLTLLHIHPQVEVAIIEMGANHVGEIAELCGYANPTHGLITNIGEAHTELFGGIEGVLRGKSELFDHLRQKNGKAFINVDDFRLENMAKRFTDPVLFPAEDLKLIDANPYLIIKLGDQEVQTNLVGRYNYGNIAAAVAVGREFGVADDQVLEAIASYIPENQRSQIIKKNSVTIINDCYNANPTSMKAALDNLESMTGKKAVILGEMKELQDAVDRHLDVGRWIKKAGFDQVILVGRHMIAAEQLLENVYWFETVEAARPFLEKRNFKDYTVLIKGSRSGKLDRVAEMIKE